MADPDRRYQSRKFILASASLLIAVGLRSIDWIDGAQAVHLITFTLGLYMVGNVGDTWAGR